MSTIANDSEPFPTTLPPSERKLTVEELPTAQAEYLRAMRGEREPATHPLLRFAGGPVDTTGMRASGPTRTTLSNQKLTRPAETYPGEAERMIETFTRLAVESLKASRCATSGPRLVSELEEAQHLVAEALRWAKP